MPEPSKVIYNGSTLIDLTEDSVTPDTLAYGVTAHSASGDIITGTAYKNTYYVKGTQVASTNQWTGNLLEVAELYNGLTIDYWLPFAGTSTAATLNLTLMNNVQSGPVNVYYSSTSRVTTHIGANNVMRLVYQTVTISGTNYTGWWLIKAYDTDDTAHILIETNAQYKAKSTVYRYQLLFHTDADTLTPLNNVNNSTATTKAMLTDVDIDPFGKIYYYNSTTTVNANSGMTTALNYHRYGIDLRYSLNCGQTLTAHKNVYLKVIKQSNGMVRLAPESCWAQELPSSKDNFMYIFLGRASSAYQFTLYEEHPIYYHDGTGVRLYIQQSDSGLLSIQNPNIFSGTINFRKINNVVQINAYRINLVSSVSYGNYVELGTIPVGFRPQSGFYPASISGSSNQVGTGFNLLAYNIGSGYSQPFVVEINPSGTIVLYATAGTVHTLDNVNISAMYFTD